MFIRSTSPEQLNVPLTSANKVFLFFNYGNKSKATGLDKISQALQEGTDTWAYDIDRGKINAVVFFGYRVLRDPFIKINIYGIIINPSMREQQCAQYETNVNADLENVLNWSRAKNFNKHGVHVNWI